MISTLSTVNDMLGLLGEFPISDLDILHPVVPRALSTLDTSNTSIQGASWWFNTETVTLSPQVGTGFLLLPIDTLGIDNVPQFPNVTQRGNRLYNLDKATDVFDKDTVVTLRRLVPFDDLPHNARAYIRARALLAFQFSIDGDAQKSGEIKQEANDAFVTLNSEHIRNKKTNMFNRPGVLFTLGSMQQGMRRRRF